MTPSDPEKVPLGVTLSYISYSVRRSGFTRLSDFWSPNQLICGYFLAQFVLTYGQRVLYKQVRALLRA